MKVDKFHQYTLEDGTVLSTVDRFVSGTRLYCPHMFTRNIIALELPPVAAQIPTEEELFDQEGKPRINFLRDHFIAEGKLTTSQTMQIIELGTALLSKEANLLELAAPITSTI